MFIEQSCNVTIALYQNTKGLAKHSYKIYKLGNSGGKVATRSALTGLRGNRSLCLGKIWSSTTLGVAGRGWLAARHTFGAAVPLVPPTCGTSLCTISCARCWMLLNCSGEKWLMSSRLREARRGVRAMPGCGTSGERGTK